MSVRQPWIKVYRDSSQRFRKLHPYTRGIAAEILRLMDDEGRIALEGETPLACLLRMLGNDRRMTNSLRLDLAELLRIEMLAVQGDYLVAPSWKKYQGRLKLAPELPQSTPQDPSNPAESLDQATSHKEKSREEENPIFSLRRVFEPSPVRQVFEHWCTVMGHPKAKLDGNRQRAIEKGLKAYGLSDCKLAIDGCAATPFYMGQNDRSKRFDSLDLIFRNAEKTEGFIAAASALNVATKPVDVAAARERVLAELRAQREQRAAS